MFSEYSVGKPSPPDKPDRKNQDRVMVFSYNTFVLVPLFKKKQCL